MLSEDKEESLVELLIDMGLLSDSFYGKLILNVQAGNIINYEKRETIKLTK